MVTVSVPGKVILMGDHAVVHGKPGLIAAINKRLTVSIEHHKTFQVISDESGDYVRHAVETVASHYKVGNIPNIKVTVVSDIPSGYHLGSSAAVAVATVGACMYFLKKIWNPAAINQLAYEVEKYTHKTPSGVDNTAITFGGFLWYRKELEFLRSFWQLPLKLSPALNHFFIIDTGRPKENTGEMVAYIKSKILNPKSKSKILDAFERNEQQTKRIAQALKEQDETELMGAIKAGERTLEDMGVVSRQVWPILRKIESSGGAAKILGGGGVKEGVGFLLAYHPDQKKLGSIVKTLGYPMEKISLGEEGVRLEKRS